MQNSYQLQNIQYYYATKLALSLDNITIKSAKTTVLIGENGSGKSTLLNILSFLEFPNLSANSRFDFQNIAVNKNKLINYRRKVGFLTQKPFMLRGTVIDNINLALKIHKKKSSLAAINTLLEQFGVAHCAMQQANNLSGGELQKVALARILILDPDVLLLDEPFSYLDQNSINNLEDFIASYAQDTGKTLIFSTHNRLQGLAIADDVIALANGKKIDTPLINLFQGYVRENVFYCEQLQITLTESINAGRHASISPQDIVLSKNKIMSSMRNNFHGYVVAITKEYGSVCINVDTGVIFQILITNQALQELQLHLGTKVWVNFKSNSVVVF